MLGLDDSALRDFTHDELPPLLRALASDTRVNADATRGAPGMQGLQRSAFPFAWPAPEAPRQRPLISEFARVVQLALGAPLAAFDAPLPIETTPLAEPHTVDFPPGFDSPTPTILLDARDGTRIRLHVLQPHTVLVKLALHYGGAWRLDAREPSEPTSPAADPLYERFCVETARLLLHADWRAFADGKDALQRFTPRMQELFDGLWCTHPAVQQGLSVRRAVLRSRTLMHLGPSYQLLISNLLRTGRYVYAASPFTWQQRDDLFQRSHTELEGAPTDMLRMFLATFTTIQCHEGRAEGASVRLLKDGVPVEGAEGFGPGDYEILVRVNGTTLRGELRDGYAAGWALSSFETVTQIEALG